jgi:hypothetical protein
MMDELIDGGGRAPIRVVHLTLYRILDNWFVLSCYSDYVVAAVVVSYESVAGRHKKRRGLCFQLVMKIFAQRAGLG